MIQPTNNAAMYYHIGPLIVVPGLYTILINQAGKGWEVKLEIWVGPNEGLI